MGPQDLRLCGIDWIALAWDKDSWLLLVNVVMKLRVSYTAGNLLTSPRSLILSDSPLHGVSQLSVFQIMITPRVNNRRSYQTLKESDNRRKPINA